MTDYKITFHSNRSNEPIVYTKSRFINAYNWVKKLMIGLEAKEKIIIERK